MTLRGGPRKGSMIAPGYRVLGRLNRSNAYDVFDVWDMARGCRCIVKTIRPDRHDETRLINRLLWEGRRLQEFAHPHLVRAWEVHREPRPLVVLETLTGQTLAHFIDTADTRISAKDAAWLGLHMSSAVRYLHTQGLLHLDLKPSNIVAQENRAIIIDLSVARAPGKMRPGIGTWCYMAPEQARGGWIDAAADVWGIGIVLWEMLVGEQAIDGQTGDYPQLDAPIPAVHTLRRVPGELGALVDGCLSPDPDDRPTVDGVITGLARVAGLGDWPPR